MSTAGAVNPVNVIQNVAPVARQSDNSAPDVPFGQVLSREIADRRGAGDSAGVKQAQPNLPVRPNQASNAGKTAEADDAKALAPKQEDDTHSTDAASAEILALVNNLVQAAGMALDPSAQAPAADIAAKGVDASRAGAALKAADPAVLGRVIPRATLAQAKIPADAQPATDPSALPDVIADAAAATTLPEKASLNPANELAQSANVPGKVQLGFVAELPRQQASLNPASGLAQTATVPDQVQPELVVELPRQTEASANAELKVALQAKTPSQPQDKALVNADAVANLTVQNSGVQQTSAAATAAAEPMGKARAANPGSKEAQSKLIEAEPEAPAKSAANMSNSIKAPETGKLAASPTAVEFSTIKTHEAALQPAAANPAAMAGQIHQAVAFATEAVHGNAAEKLSPRVGTPAWDQALGQKVVWMVAGGVQSASLTLNPPDLGPLQVVLSISNSQANASFTAAQPEVRQALEASMPRLREMLADSGIQLGQSTVSAGTQNQYNGPSDQPQQPARQFSQPASVAEAAPVTPRPADTRTGANGLVDTFA